MATLKIMDTFNNEAVVVMKILILPILIAMVIMIKYGNDDNSADNSGGIKSEFMMVTPVVKSMRRIVMMLAMLCWRW